MHKKPELPDHGDHSHFGEIEDEVQGFVGGTEAALGVMVGRLQAPQALSHSLTDHTCHATQILQYNLHVHCDEQLRDASYCRNLMHLHHQGWRSAHIAPTLPLTGGCPLHNA